MEINSINTIFCKPVKFNQNNSNISKINFKGLEADTFSKSTDNEKEKKHIQNERAKLRFELYSAMERSAEEKLKELLNSEYITYRTLHGLKKDYQTALQSSWRSKPTPKIGTIIDDAIAQAEIDKANGKKNLTQKYSEIKSNLKYDDNGYVTSIFKQALKSKDGVLLRVALDTLRKSEKPYGELLINAHNELMQEEAKKIAAQITEKEIEERITNAKNKAVKDTVLQIFATRE